MYSEKTRPVTLTIAGSDSGGGAGIQADLKTFAANQCYGTSVITALTAQNTIGVQGIHACPPDFVKQQLESVLDDIKVDAMKTGMLHNTETVHTIAETLKDRYSHPGAIQPPLVCDPVSVSTSGHELLSPDAIQTLIREIFPLATLITPNKSEAELILSSQGRGVQIENIEDMILASSSLLSFGCKAVLLKGGHVTTTPGDLERVLTAHPEFQVVKHALLDQNMEILRRNQENVGSELVVDLLQESTSSGEQDGSRTLFVRPRINSTSTHGTGCTLSAAITCGLAQGLSLQKAVEFATAYTHLGIETAFHVGEGHGPLNHGHSTMQRIVPRATKTVSFPMTKALIQSTSVLWREYVEHEFVRELGRGTLDKRFFIHFIKQDYHYLKYYARAYAFLAAKSSNFTAIESAALVVNSVVREVSLVHLKVCSKWGITEEELERTPESAATTSYGAFLIDTGLQGDAAKLTMALAACLLGYGEVGLWLLREAERPDTWVVLDKEVNPYVHWIEDYSGAIYQEAVKVGLASIEELAELNPPTKRKFEEWQSVWKRCVRLEKGFWDMALQLS